MRENKFFYKRLRETTETFKSRKAQLIIKYHNCSSKTCLENLVFK